MFPALFNVTLYIIYVYAWCYCCGNRTENVEKEEQQHEEASQAPCAKEREAVEDH